MASHTSRGGVGGTPPSQEIIYVLDSLMQSEAIFNDIGVMVVNQNVSIIVTVLA